MEKNFLSAKAKNLQSIFKSRRIIREYKDKAIPHAIIESIIDAVRYAPSALNGQPWEIIIVTEDAIKHQLMLFKNRWCPSEKKAYKADYLKSAPAIFIVCSDCQRSYDRWIENAVIASTYIILAAASFNLTCGFMTAFNLDKPEQIKEARDILKIPDHINPVCILPVGYPAKHPADKKLRDLKEIMHYEKYGGLVEA